MALAAEQIEKDARIAFEGPLLTGLLRAGGRSTTMSVKERFGDLGRRLGYKVAAAGYRHADEGEWLYDMVWYLLDKRHDDASDYGARVRVETWRFGQPKCRGRR